MDFKLPFSGHSSDSVGCLWGCGWVFFVFRTMNALMAFTIQEHRCILLNGRLGRLFSIQRTRGGNID